MLFQRDEQTGYPVGADHVMRDAYGKIPEYKRFQCSFSPYVEKAQSIEGWDWSATFGRWTALVTFPNGRQEWTFPVSW